MAPSKYTESVVRVGIGALILDKEGRVLMGERKSAHEDGTLGFPGGKLDVGESWHQCAERETLEETGLRITAIKPLAVRNIVFNPQVHYVDIVMLCRREDEEQEPVVTEPHKCHGWRWYSWAELYALKNGTPEQREKLFKPVRMLLDAFPNMEETLRGLEGVGRVAQDSFIIAC